MANMIPGIDPGLIENRVGSQACTLNDIYVGSSRGRFLLYIFHEAGYQFENK